MKACLAKRAAWSCRRSEFSGACFAQACDFVPGGRRLFLLLAAAHRRAVCRALCALRGMFASCAGKGVVLHCTCLNTNNPMHMQTSPKYACYNSNCAPRRPSLSIWCSRRRRRRSRLLPLPRLFASCLVRAPIALLALGPAVPHAAAATAHERRAWSAARAARMRRLGARLRRRTCCLGRRPRHCLDGHRQSRLSWRRHCGRRRRRRRLVKGGQRALDLPESAGGGLSAQPPARLGAACARDVQQQLTRLVGGGAPPCFLEAAAKRRSGAHAPQQVVAASQKRAAPA